MDPMATRLPPQVWDQVKPSHKVVYYAALPGLYFIEGFGNFMVRDADTFLELTVDSDGVFSGVEHTGSLFRHSWKERDAVPLEPIGAPRFEREEVIE